MKNILLNGNIFYHIVSTIYYFYKNESVHIKERKTEIEKEERKRQKLEKSISNVKVVHL